MSAGWRLVPTGESYYGGCLDLHFKTRAESAEFEAADFDLRARFYHKQVQRHGIWAGNQGKFVASPDMLNDWDSRDDWNKYRIWLAKQPKGT